MAANKYSTIYDLANDEHTVEVQGKTMRLYKMGPRKMSALAKRFPDAKFIQDLENPAAKTELDADGNPTMKVSLADLEVIIAMAAMGLGYVNDLAAEDWLEEALEIDEIVEIMTKSLELSTGEAPKDFGKRSA